MYACEMIFCCMNILADTKDEYHCVFYITVETKKNSAKKITAHFFAQNKNNHNDIVMIQ
jgi:hypothetical protein